MLDLHSHLLPGIDDGAPDLSTTLAMAGMFVEQGVTHVACTPHILPGVYHNTGAQIRAAVERLQRELDERGIVLELVAGADNHVVPTFVQGLRAGHLLTLGDTRYVLVEPPHNTAPMRLEELFFGIQVAGYVPVLTHPERLSWIREKYDIICRLADRGILMQITCGSLRGAFGSRPQYWAERMLDEGRVHILATDAHDTRRRPPDLAAGRDVAARRVGQAEADNLVEHRPLAMLNNVEPQSLPPLAAIAATNATAATEVSFGEHLSHASSHAPLDGPSHVSASGGIAGRLRRLFG